jgi:hypothetical protein
MKGLIELLLRQRFKIGATFKVECFDKDGNLKWVDENHNVVVNVGLDEILNQFFKGSAYTAAHYVGLKNTGAVQAGDTMASHANWTEFQGYSEANRVGYVPGAVSGQSVDNSGSVAQFNITATGTVFGAFLCDENTKGGTTGILVSAEDFAASRGVADGDLMKVTITYNASDA